MRFHLYVPDDNWHLKVYYSYYHIGALSIIILFEIIHRVNQGNEGPWVFPGERYVLMMHLQTSLQQSIIGWASHWLFDSSQGNRGPYGDKGDPGPKGDRVKNSLFLFHNTIKLDC